MVTRRTVLGTLSTLGVVAATGVLPARGAASAQALGQQETIEAAMKRLFGGRPRSKRWASRRRSRPR